MVQQTWIIKCLRMYRISDKILNFISNAMENWRVKLTVSGQTLAKVRDDFNMFPDVFVQAFKIVIDSWKFTMLFLYNLWDDYIWLPIVQTLLPVTFAYSLSSEEMKEAVTKVIDTLTQEDFHGAFQKCLERYNKYIAAGGNNFIGD